MLGSKNGSIIGSTCCCFFSSSSFICFGDVGEWSEVVGECECATAEAELRGCELLPPQDAVAEAIILFLVPPLNMALMSSHAYTISSGGSPRSFVCRRHELKFAASGCTYLSLSERRCEWKTNLLGEKKTPQK